MVRRLVWDQDGAGSIPVTPTMDAALTAERAAKFDALRFFVL